MIGRTTGCNRRYMAKRTSAIKTPNKSIVTPLTVFDGIFFSSSLFFLVKEGGSTVISFLEKKRKMLLQQSEQKPVYKEKIVLHHFSKKGKKIALPSQSKKNEDKKYYVETFQFNLPEVLTDDFFFRHQLTLPDYEKILSGSKKISHLWALALYKKVEITATSVSSCFMRNPSSNLGGCNKNVVTSLIRKMQTQIQDMKEVQGWTPKIVCPHDECIPPLPVHFVGQEFLNTLPAPATSYSCAWHFQLNPKMPPILCVPCNFYHGYLMMIRVEKKNEYQQRLGFPKNLAELPNEYMINNQVYYGVEECFLLQTVEAHRNLCNNQDPAFLHSLDNTMLWQGCSRAL